MRYLRLSLLFSFLTLLLPLVSAQAGVDLRYCVVKNSSDNVESIHSLRRKVKEGFNRTGSDRACTERISFDPEQDGGAYSITLGSTLYINNPDDQNQDDDGFNFVVDGSDALGVEIHAEGLPESECAFKVNANKVRLTDMTVFVKKFRQAVCKENSDLEVDISGLTILAEDDPDKDKVPNDEDNCPQRSNPDQANADEDKHGDACDNCPLAKNDDQADSDSDGIGDACEHVPDPSPTPDPTPTPTATPTPTPPATPTPTPTPTPTATPTPTPVPTDSPIVTAPPADPNDHDGDDVPNASDNCPTIGNADQADSDGDHIGDACDPSNNGSNPPGEGPTIDLSGTSTGCSLHSAHLGSWMVYGFFLIPSLIGMALKRIRRR